MEFQRRTLSYETVDLKRDDVITVTEAAEMLGLTLPGVIAAIQRGEFTELVDPNAEHQQRERRFLIREEVQAGADRRHEPHA